MPTALLLLCKAMRQEFDRMLSLRYSLDLIKRLKHLKYYFKILNYLLSVFYIAIACIRRNNSKFHCN
jgi:hypothetical protein